jgi:hypothetical protein
MIAESERRRMLAVPLCGPRVIRRLESIGVTKLSDLRGKDAHDLMHEINIEASWKIWRPPIAIIALENLIGAANRQR